MYILKKTKLVNLIKKHKFVRFLLVGVINTLFGYFSFATLILIGLDYKLAALLATILGVLFNFQTTGRLVFGSKNNKLIFRFVLVYVVTFLLNVEALRIVDAAKACGADAVKLQTYRAETIKIDHHGDEFIVQGGGAAYR